MNDKIANGVFFTTGNPFRNPAFDDWAARAGMPATRIIEPFAGANHLVSHLRGMGFCRKADSFDIAPAASGIARRDTLASFPPGYETCITNPPWLAKNRATRLGLPFPDTRHDDLYKVALGKCLENCAWVAAVVPESFIRSGLFQARLGDFVSLTGRMFADTDHPVGLALFEPSASGDVRVWRDGVFIDELGAIERSLPVGGHKGSTVRFNDSGGNVGLIAVDNTREASIRFCDPRELGDYRIRHSCRSITRIGFEGKVRIDEWNGWIDRFRRETADVLLTSFKGRRQDGAYRRRMDFRLARGIIGEV